MDLSLEHCGSEEHLKVERMYIITKVFWDKFSANDSFLKKQVITAGGSKYLRALRKRGSRKQKLVIACNQFASVYLLWFRCTSWFKRDRLCAFGFWLKRFSTCWKKDGMKYLHERIRHDCVQLSCFNVCKQRAQVFSLSACGWEAEEKAGAFVRAESFCTWNLVRQRVAYLAIINYTHMLVFGQMVVSVTVRAHS